MHLIITKLDIQPGFGDYGQVHKFDKVASSEFPENVYIQLPIATFRVPKKGKCHHVPSEGSMAEPGTWHVQ